MKKGLNTIKATLLISALLLGCGMNVYAEETVGMEDTIVSNDTEIAETKEDFSEEIFDNAQDSIALVSESIMPEATPISGFYTDSFGDTYYYNPSTGDKVFGERWIGNLDTGHWYYFDEATGVMATDWTKHHGHTYYYDDNGWMQYGYQTIDGNQYYFDWVTGVMFTGERVENGHWVYYSEETGAKAYGWTKHHGNRYYYDNNGWMKYGYQTIDGNQYYFDWVTGAMFTGERVENGHWVYYSEETGAKAYGWTKHHGHQYYYDSNGWMLYGNQVIEGNQYYFNPYLGIMFTGERVENGHWVYYSESTGAKAYGWTDHHGHRYYYNSKGWMLYGEQMIDGKAYTFDNVTGVLQYGFYTVDGNVYYRDMEGNQLYGNQLVDGKIYAFDEITGALRIGLVDIDGNTYLYRNTEPYMYTDEIYYRGGWRYFDETTGVMATGWTKHHGNTYYYDENGKMLYGLQVIDGEEYYFHPVTGVMQPMNGWVQKDGAWKYYVDEEEKYSFASLNEIYNWSSSAITYQKIADAPGGVSHIEWYSNYGFTNQTGNCYVMAATFCHVARLMGYEAYLVEGYVPLARGGMGPHGWVEIVQDGTIYVCDPDFAYETGRNGYFITYGTSGTWRYSNYSRVE